MFYMIAKDHTIGNGNKRCAVIITVIFLILNDKVPSFNPDQMYELAKRVAQSDARKSEANIEALKVIFKGAVVDLPDEDEVA